MRKLFFVLLSLSIFQTAYADSDHYFQTSCTVYLIGCCNERILTATSPEFKFDGTIYNDAGAKIEMGDITLFSQVIMNEPTGGRGIQPTLNMELFRGNPINGKINSARLQGMQLESRAVNAPLTLYGVEFLNITLDEREYMRIDYNCSVTRTR